MMLPTEPQKKRKWLFVLVLVAIYIWAFAGIPLATIKENVGQILGAIFYGLELCLYRGWRRFVQFND